MEKKLKKMNVYIYMYMYIYTYMYKWGFPGGSAGKESAYNAGDPGSFPGKIPWRKNRLHTPLFLGFPGGLVGKESACNAGDLGSIPGLGRTLGEGHGNPLQYSCLPNPQRQRSLVCYSPWGHKESDTTEATEHICMYK